MADILIKGLALPTDGSELVIKITRHRQIAKVYGNPSTRGSSWLIVHGATAVTLPEHGRLKDADFMLECLEAIKKDYPEAYKLISGVIERTPTVVEATE